MLNFDLDARALRVFRFGLGALILWDLFDRSFSWSILMGELAVPSTWTRWSLFAISDSVIFQGLLILILVAAAVALMVDRFTQAASVIAFVLVTSVQNRNPWILFGADDVLRVMLLWSAFLPKYPALLIGQVVAIFFFAGINKVLDPVWLGGDGLQLSMSAYPGLLPTLTPSLLKMTLLLTVANYFAILMQLSAVLLIFKRTRLPVAVALIAMQAAMALTIDLGWFPFACAVALIALLPMIPLLPATPLPSWQWKNQSLSNQNRIRPGVLFLTTALALPLIGATSTMWPKAIPDVIASVGLFQNWKFFTPPPKISYWLSITGRTQDSHHIDLGTKQPFTGHQRPPLYQGWSRLRWSALASNINKNPLLASRLSDALCKQGRSQLKDVEIKMVTQENEAFTSVNAQGPDHLRASSSFQRLYLLSTKACAEAN